VCSSDLDESASTILVNLAAEGAKHLPCDIGPDGLNRNGLLVMPGATGRAITVEMVEDALNEDD
jgi:hypothetical protein